MAVACGSFSTISNDAIEALATSTGRPVAEWRRLLMPAGPGRILFPADDEHLVAGLRAQGLTAGLVNVEGLAARARGAVEVLSLSTHEGALVLGVRHIVPDGSAREEREVLGATDVAAVLPGRAEVAGRGYQVGIRTRSADVGREMLLGDAVQSTIEQKTVATSALHFFIVIAVKDGGHRIVRLPRCNVTGLGITAPTAAASWQATVAALGALGLPIDRSCERVRVVPGFDALGLDVEGAIVLSSILQGVLGASPPAAAGAPPPPPVVSTGGAASNPTAAQAESACVLCSAKLSLEEGFYSVAGRSRCASCFTRDSPELVPGPARRAWVVRTWAGIAALSVVILVAGYFIGWPVFALFVVAAGAWQVTFGADEQARRQIDRVDATGRRALTDL